ncbi:MAG: DUF2975 domain-containing protein [Oscillospiraceae bacterium]|nr:DUF2975 domain-containing protein [Oscillospiraceae bacterium]
MENNFDTVKLNNIERTRRLAKPALILTVLFLAAQCIRSGYNLIVTLSQPHTFNGTLGSAFAALAYAELPETIAKFVFSAATLIPLIMLFRNLRKDGQPFTERNAKLLKAAGILQGLRAAVPALIYFFSAFRYDGFSNPHNFLDVFDHRTLSYPAVGFCILLLFLARTFRYGSVLQQESDETL